jgi:predicted alpha-1,2-mannosidase
MRILRSVAQALVLAALPAALGPSGASARGPTARSSPDYGSLVRPFMGTDSGARDFGTGGGAGATFPGATLPFGMAQFSPDTFPSITNFAGGYTFSDARIRGFSLDHFSGGGCAIFQDVPILPTTSPVTVAPVKPGSSDLENRYLASFDHARESASPGDYRVTLNPGTRRSLKSELTVTVRTADGRFTFPRTRSASLLINVGGSTLADSAGEVRIDPRTREVSGSATSGGFCLQPAHYRVYFAARFSRPFAASGTWKGQRLAPGGTTAAATSPGAYNYKPIPGGPPSLPGDPSSGVQLGAYVTFDARRERTVDTEVGISFTSVAEARRNLRIEAAQRSFESIRRAAAAAWRVELAKVRVHGGTRPERTLFYTSLYHALLEPNVFSDADGSYRGMDDRVHRAAGFTKYANVSGWDVYRTQTQLMAMLEPRRASDLVSSLLADARQSGCLPRWPYANQQTNVMVGDPSAAIISDVDAFGARGFDAASALSAMTRGASTPCHTVAGDYTEREGLEPYLRLGYVPYELNTDVTGHTVGRRDHAWGSAATTLEYALADFAIGRMAARHNRATVAAAFGRRAANWRKLFDPATRYIEPRLASGAFLPDFKPTGIDGFVEGDGAQYRWFVPQDPAGLIAKLGGARAASSRLGDFFAQLNAGPSSPHAFLGNEPTLDTPWLYEWLGEPGRTTDILRRALLGLYRPTPAGMPGNDDGGEMSAWWVLAALGIYPAVPGTDLLALSGPLFPSATLELAHGRLTLSANGASSTERYIASARRDGRTLRRSWIRFAQVARGNHEIRLRMSSRPGRDWGTAPSSRPPSGR